jgi:hypothetical protein
MGLHCLLQGQLKKSNGGSNRRHQRKIMRSFIMWHVDPLLGNDREISNYKTAINVMALQTSAVTRQWLSRNRVGTPTGTKATMAHHERNGVFCAVVT